MTPDPDPDQEPSQSSTNSDHDSQFTSIPELTATEAADDADLTLRLRLLADQYASVVLIGLILLTFIAGGFAYTTVTASPPEPETVVVANWSEQGSFTHGAVVQNENPLFDTGNRLSDRPGYYQQVTPAIDGMYAYSYTAPSGDVRVDIETTLIKQSVTTDGNVLWRDDTALDQRRVAGISPGERVTTDFEINVAESVARIDAIEEGLGATRGETELFVRTSVTTVGTVANESVRTSHTNQLTIEPEGGFYTVSSDGRYEQSHPIRAEQSPDQEVADAALSPWLLLTLLALTGSIGFGIMHLRGHTSLSPFQRRRYERQQTRREFDDWITTGELPDSVDDPEVTVGSLEGIIDVAIDSDARVIEDAEQGAYYVVGENVVYVFRPAPLSMADGE